MLQFYFLSILLNLLMGLVLVYGTDFYKRTSMEILSDSAKDNFEDGAETERESTDDFSERAEETEGKTSTFAQKNAIFDDSTFRLIIGILGFMVSVLKFCSPIQNDAKVVGDLLPALAGLLSSSILLIEFFNEKSSAGLSLPAPVETVICDGRKYIGIFCVLVAILHFVCPKILFL